MEEELRSFYDLTYEEDRQELAQFILRGVRLDTTITAPEDLSEVKEAVNDLCRRMSAELIELDTSQWPKRLIIKFRIGNRTYVLKLSKIEEGAYRPELTTE
ncbi:MAG: hypothetical protein GXO23_04885 [Crenarchaeota archaeon]|nr:hypothetical protein [Thermoproteota archaeon]